MGGEISQPIINDADCARIPDFDGFDGCARSSQSSYQHSVIIFYQLRLNDFLVCFFRSTVKGSAYRKVAGPQLGFRKCGWR